MDDPATNRGGRWYLQSAGEGVRVATLSWWYGTSERGSGKLGCL